MYKEEILKEFVLTFDNISQDENPKNIPYRIKWKGKLIRTSSGKTVWKKIGDAKSAFRLEIEPIIYRVIYKITGEKYPPKENINHVFNMILNSGFVEFVPLTE